MQTILDINSSLWGTIVEKGEPGTYTPFFESEWDGNELELWVGRWHVIVSPWPRLAARRARARWLLKRCAAGE